MVRTLASPVLTALKAPQGSHIDPARLAKKMHMTLADVASLARVHRNTLTCAPESAEVQRALKDIVGILQRATDVAGGDENLAIYWFRNQMLPGFDNQTAQDVVRDGHPETVLTVLDMVEHGVPL